MSDLATSIERTKLQLRLNWYEDQFRSRAKALAAIFIELRDDPMRPWRLNHDTYEAYCADVWSMTPRRLQQITAGESLKALLASQEPELANVVAQMPEGQMRALAGVPEAKRVEVLKVAVSTPGKMTARKIKEAKARVIEPASVPDLVLDEEATFEQPTPASLPSIVFDYAKIINSLAFLTDEQRAGFFALLGASYCIHCGAVSPCQDCPRHLPFTPASATV